MKQSPLLAKRPLVFGTVFGAVFLCQTISAYLIGTSVFATTNGIWKLSSAELWSRGEGHIDYANVLYLSFATVVTSLSAYFGVNPSALLVFANVVFMSVAAGIIALTIARLTNSVPLAIGWAIAFGLSGNALTNSLGSEDIAGAVLGISLVIYSFTYVQDRQSLTVPMLMGLALTLALVHLWEWRSALPLYLGIGIAWLIRARRRSWSENIRELAIVSSTILASLVAVVWAVVEVFRLSHNQAWFWPLGVVFPGKGLGTVWAGFTTEKLELQLVGLSENVIGGRNLASASVDNWTLLSALAVVAVYFLFGFGIRRGLESPDHRFISLVGFWTWAGGALFALYTQPQDPQMQVTQSPQLFLWAALGAQSLVWKFLGWKLGFLSQLLVPAFLVAVSLSHFQGVPPIWKEQNKSDNEFFEEARLLHANTSSGRGVLYGSGWETQLAWISLFNSGENINHIGFHGPFDEKKVNGFFPVNFISANPSGSPRDWICASVAEYKAIATVLVVPVEQNRPLNFMGYRTVASDAAVEEYQNLWELAYGTRSGPNLAANFEESHCS